MRSSFSRRDGAIETISRAVALLCRNSQNPQGALQQAKAERPDDYELHETLMTRAAVVPTSASTVTQFSQTSVADVGAVIGPTIAFTLVSAKALAIDLDGSSASVSVPLVTAAPDTVGFVAPGSPGPV